MRPSFPEYGVMLAKTASLRSEDPFTKVGAVAFDKNWYTLGTFYNGFLPKQDIDPKIWLNRDEKNARVIHAEHWLISKTANGTVYRVCLNISPCSRCAVLLAAHGVKEIYYAEEYHRETDFKNSFDLYGVKYQQITLNN